VEEKAGGHRTGVFWVALEPSAAEVGDQVDGASQTSREHTLAAVALPHEATGDSPVWRRGPFLLVGRSVLDPGNFAGRAELAPADAVRSVEHEGRVGGSGAHSPELALSVDLRCIPGNPLGMEANTPAAAEDSVVALDERRESRPGRLVESFDPVERTHGPESFIRGLSDGPASISRAERARISAGGVTCERVTSHSVTTPLPGTPTIGSFRLTIPISSSLASRHCGTLTPVRAVEIVFAVGWAAFWLYWLVAAFSMKRGRIPWSRELRIRALIVGIVVILVRFGVFRGQGLNTDPRRAALGLALFGLGLGFAIWARVHIGRNWGTPMTQKEEPELVTSGPYHLVRHPIYSGILVAGVGTAMALSWLWLIAMGLAGLYFLYSATVEERYLTKQFPNSYPAYKQSTKMLVPFIF
jgi:protein-S-isoprenylcysteine O-methyltransferase Ste14